MTELHASFTILIILGAVIASFCAFNNPGFHERWMFHPEAILAGKQYHRVLTSAFVHVSWPHLIFNMLSLYFFAPSIELWVGKAHFLLIFFGSVVGGSLLSLYLHRHHDYRACGASGGVCGIIFAYILLFPGSSIMMFPLPIGVPGWLYAIVFLVASFYALRAQRDNIGHDAHIGGAIIGLLITAALHPGWVLQQNLKLFLAVLLVSAGLFVYLWRNPVMTPMRSFTRPIKIRFRKPRQTLPKHRRDALQVDAILEKISEKGMESLSDEERAFLEETSGKYRRRAESRKPESGLAI